ncbi:MAG: cation-translocating P-type ATPase [Chloroflexi bacterium]|nr:cation-translocating P-type ATPase [Chloroflexota bacterium]
MRPSVTSPSPQPGDPRQDERVWHALEVSDLLPALGTSPERGLTTDEAARRLARYGHNELAEKPRPGFWKMLLGQLSSFIVIVLIVAGVISAILGDYIEAAAILAIVALNAVLGVVQERRAEEALAALRRMAAPEAQVIRDGHRVSVPARDLVPGDLVILEAGNFVPADLRLVETVNLRIEEAALTGESVAVEKDARVVLRQDVPLGDRLNTAFMGTVVAYGRGRGLVVTTGMHTQIGLIAAMLQVAEDEQTPLQRKLDQLGKVLGWAALGVCALVFLVGWGRGYEPFEMFIIAVSLAVAAVPEGLAAVVTITLALGMREMIKRHALIRRLASVETLGSTTVICSDKTGTLTQNQMTVTRLWVDETTLEVTGQGYDPVGQFRVDGKPVDLTQMPGVSTALWAAVLANDAEIEMAGEGEASRFRVVGDPTESALVVAAAKGGADRGTLSRAYPRINEIPFDSDRKRMTTLHRVVEPSGADASPFTDDQQREWVVAAMKGAPDIVLGLCTHVQHLDDSRASLTEAMRRQILEANSRMAQQALRVLAVAYRVEEEEPGEVTVDVVERDLTFVGLFGMIDPGRAEVPPAIDTARRAGIRTVMITGDFANTARAVAEQIGLMRPGGQVLTGSELARMDDATLTREVVRTDVYARVSPEHKVRIVDALKANGEIVAMTGDGVNDAPALKRADIGVAMGITGTDVAKETADMVLTDDNYASIVSAVEIGRIIYSNIRAFGFYLLSCHLGEIAIIFVAKMAGLPSPLTAIQLLWLNLVTDGAPALALGMEKGDPDTMDQPPRPPDEPVINRSMQLGIILQTLAIAGVTLGAYFVGLHAHPEQPEFAETMSFATLSFSELLRAFTARSERYPLLRIGVFSNRTMVYAVLSSVLLVAAVLYVPFLQPVFNTVTLGWAQWQLMLPLVLVPAVVAELTKWGTSLRARRAAR